MLWKYKSCFSEQYQMLLLLISLICDYALKIKRRIVQQSYANIDGSHCYEVTHCSIKLIVKPWKFLIRARGCLQFPFLRIMWISASGNNRYSDCIVGLHRKFLYVIWTAFVFRFLILITLFTLLFTLSHSTFCVIMRLISIGLLCI